MSLTRDYEDGKTRCAWPGSDALYLEYHDTEWGVPLTGDDEMFERVALEGFQAGLSWITILKRREGFRAAFHGFEIAQVAQMTSKEVEPLMNNTSIIRNRAKIEATIHNAKIAQNLEGGISNFIWSLAPTERVRPAENFAWIARDSNSDRISRELKRLGFKFVGSTTMFALMQAIGMINDHAPDCFRRQEIG